PDASCSRCHALDTKVMPIIAALADRLRATGERAAHARSELARAGALGLFVPRGASALAELHTAETRLAPAIHAFDAHALDVPAAEVERATAQIETIVADAERARRIERRWYALAAFPALLLFVGLVIKAARLTRRAPT